MSQRQQTDQQRPPQGQQRPPQDESGGSFATHPSVKWTIGRNLAGFTLLGLCVGLAIFFAPDLTSIMGLEGTVSEASDELPTGLTTMNFTRLIVGLFGVLFWLAGGPVVGAILGTMAGAGRDAPRSSLTFASAIGAFVGYFIPMVLVLVSLSSLNPLGDFGAGAALVSAILVTLPTTLAAAGMTFLTS